MDTRLQKQSKRLMIVKWVCIAAFLPYIGCVLYLTLLNREPTVQRSMLTPFWEYRNLLNGYRRRFYFEQIVGNLVMLLPLGFMLPAMAEFFRKGLWTVLAAFLSSVAIELTQWFTSRGLMEFDDVFNNTVGGAAGYLLFWLYFWHCRRKEKW